MKLPVASLCPFPVGCIFDSAKALFEAVVPIEMHKEAIYDGLEQGLALHIDWEPIREVAEIDGTNKIHSLIRLFLPISMDAKLLHVGYLRL